MQKTWLVGGLTAFVTLCGCAADSDDSAAEGTSSSSGATTTGAPATTDPGTETSDSASASASETTVSADSSSGGSAEETTDPGTSGGPIEPTDPFDYLCGSTPPDDAEAPAPLPAPSGECPAFVPGVNTFASSGEAREVIVVAPSDLQPDEQLPVAMLWHWLGGSAEDFIEVAEVQSAVDQFRFLALVAVDKGDLLFRWPFTTVDSDARVQEEFVYFDDLLACAAESYPIDNTCVTSVGVSAGALFTSQLGWARSEYLASIVSLSGGTGGLVREWGGAEHILPAMVLWGGPEDFCIAVDFAETSANLEAELEADGHAVIECEHNCGHAAPPFETPDPELTPFAGMWRFFLDHPYWLGPGESPWQTDQPTFSPQWCSVGVGSSTPREGKCPDGPGC
ncbi:MAG: alpha/beta hydrolase [Nannocystaceae bacterium]|nr:hypothetical protein [bacterium]